MLTLNTLMELTKPFISAASGLIKIDDQCYVIADDENFVGRFDLRNKMGETFTLFQDLLPDDKDERKKLKKDFEAMVYLPRTQSILVLPSGSTHQRETAALMNLNGELVQVISLHELYQSLRLTITELNIEGGVLIEDSLYLFQRGNGVLGMNALVKLSYPALVLDSILPVDLGEISGVKLTFTDATNFGENFLFLAVAEASASTYLDGEVVGSILGILSPQGRILAQEQLQIISKPEGLSFSKEDFSFLVVTDDDDRAKPAQLMLGKLPLEWKSFLL